MDDWGVPLNYRHMEGFGVHTFVLVNAAGKETLVKFHWKPSCGGWVAGWLGGGAGAAPVWCASAWRWVQEPRRGSLSHACSAVSPSIPPPRCLCTLLCLAPPVTPFSSHLRCAAGVKFLLEDEAVVVGGSNHSHATQDLYDSIARGEYPEWQLLIQTMDPAVSCGWRGMGMVCIAGRGRASRLPGCLAGWLGCCLAGHCSACSAHSVLPCISLMTCPFPCPAACQRLRV
jgi:hypothetical protein